MNKIWIVKSVNEWFSIDLDKIENFSCISKNGIGSDWLYINNKLVTLDEGLALFKALESFLVRGGDRDELYNEVDRFNAQKKSNQ